MVGKTFLVFPPHAQTTILRIWQEAHSNPNLLHTIISELLEDNHPPLANFLGTITVFLSDGYWEQHINYLCCIIDIEMGHIYPYCLSEMRSWVKMLSDDLLWNVITNACPTTNSSSAAPPHIKTYMKSNILEFYDNIISDPGTASNAVLT